MKKVTLLNEINLLEDKFEAEAREKYGTTNEYKASKNKTNNYSKEDWKKIMLESEEIFKAFYNNIGENITSDVVQELVVKWKNHITKYYYDCSLEILSGLGTMYITDERFRNNIDKHGIGTAQLMSKAIKYYCDNNQD